MRSKKPSDVSRQMSADSLAGLGVEPATTPLISQGACFVGVHFPRFETPQMPGMEIQEWGTERASRKSEGESRK